MSRGNGVDRQRVIATLACLEHIHAGKGDALLNSFLRALSNPTLEEGIAAVDFAPAVTVGDTWLLNTLDDLVRNTHPASSRNPIPPA